MKRANLGLSLSAAAGASLLVATAYAQQPAPNAPSPAPSTQTQGQTPAQSSPTAAPQAQSTPSTQSQSGAASQSQSSDQQRSSGPSREDRAAFMDARLASIHAGLKLSADQERLWPPVESAVRDMVRTMADLREQRRTQGMPSDPVDRMARLGEAATKRGQAMTRLAEAARPLYASLSDEQKTRLRTLMHPRLEGGMAMRDRMDRGGMMGRGDMMDRREMFERYMRDRRGMMDRDRYGDEEPGWRLRERMRERMRQRWEDRYGDDHHDDRYGRGRGYDDRGGWRDYDREDRRGNDWR